MSNKIGIHTCPSCKEMVNDKHKCKQVKVSFMSLPKAKVWLDKVLISRALK